MCHFPDSDNRFFVKCWELYNCNGFLCKKPIILTSILSCAIFPTQTIDFLLNVQLLLHISRPMVTLYQIKSTSTLHQFNVLLRQMSTSEQLQYKRMFVSVWPAGSVKYNVIDTATFLTGSRYFTSKQHQQQTRFGCYQSHSLEINQQLSLIINTLLNLLQLTASSQSLTMTSLNFLLRYLRFFAYNFSTTAVTLATRKVPDYLQRLQRWCTKSSTTAVRRISPTWSSSTQRTHNDVSCLSLTRAAVVQRTRTHFGKHAFSVCRPHTWNGLPPAVRNIDSCPAFRRALRSQLFHRAFSLLLINFYTYAHSL